MAKAHRPEVLGAWAHENGFHKTAEAFYAPNVEKRRQEGVKAWHRAQREKEEQKRNEQRKR